MSGRSVERALVRLAEPGAVLAPNPRGAGFAVFAQGDRRRRPTARLSAAAARELVASGTIAKSGDDAFALTEAGRARVRRETAAPGEAFAEQHRPVVERAVLGPDGDVRLARGFEPSPVVRRLGALKDAAGVPWLTDAELNAAAQLRRYWEAGEAGLVRGADWTAPPMGRTARGPGSAQERALAARCDARRRVAEALDALAPPLRRVLERICLREEGIEAMERAEGWPARSGKVALKLGLAQLALDEAARASC